MNEFYIGLKNIEDLVQELYSTISFSKASEANFDRFKKLFKPDARLIYFSKNYERGNVFWILPDNVLNLFNSTKNSVEQLKLETFVIRLKEQIDNGNIKSFYEYELAKTIDKFGKIAHVFSTYEAKELPESLKVIQKGINSIQLIFDKERWWITSLMWYNEDSKYEIPEKYLPHLNKAGNSK